MDQLKEIHDEMVLLEEKMAQLESLFVKQDEKLTEYELVLTDFEKKNEAEFWRCLQNNIPYNMHDQPKN